MKVGLVRRGYSPTGGAERYLMRLADALAAAGHDPVLCCTADWPETDWPHRPRAVLDGSTPARFARALARWHEGHADIHLFSLERVRACACYRAGDGVHAAWLRRRRAIEPCWRGWVRALNAKHRQLLALERALLADGGAARVIANSAMVRDEIIREYAYPTDRIRVVYNGLPEKFFVDLPGRREQERARLGLKPGEIAALFVGSGWERKGLAPLLEAMRHRGLAGVTLLVAGRGQAPQGAPANVRFLGPAADVRGLLEAGDLFVLPTLYDPFSNASLEALAAGLPVITTDANGCAEILRPAADGEIVAAPVEPLALAAALAKWAARAHDAGTREARKAHARSFTIERNLRETLAVLAT